MTSLDLCLPDRLHLRDLANEYRELRRGAHFWSKSGNNPGLAGALRSHAAAARALWASYHPRFKKDRKHI